MKLHPLRTDDGSPFNQLRNLLETVVNEGAEKRQKTQKHYKENGADVLVVNAGQLHAIQIFLPRSLTKTLYKFRNYQINEVELYN